ncbi:hypothetical protein [Sphingopyxis fribergensis]|uniref:hypothetical protein n=1 Tax=Sphingopyxis fribergensis TaxID=1515612 RepID=UPI00057CA1E8|nr:hypothetical protein [Sphingopyxis fribergensis]
MSTDRDLQFAEWALEWAIDIDEIAERAEAASDTRATEIISLLRRAEMLCNELHEEITDSAG